MLRNAAEDWAMGKDGRDAIRVTTTLTRRQHEQLEALAEKHGVAVAWLVRRSVERMLEQSNGGAPLTPDLT